VSVSSAIIEWSTDQPSDSLVEYREIGVAGEFIAVGDRIQAENHSVKIFDLKTDTPYEYRVVSRNKLGNDMVIDAVSYQTNYSKTLPSLRTAKFKIESVQKSETTSTVQFSWATSMPAKSNSIEWEVDDGSGNSQLRGIAGQLATGSEYDLLNHSVVLKGLKSNTKYRYKVKSISVDNYQAESPEGNNYYYFETKKFDSGQFTLSPSSSNVAERQITSTTAQIVWQTAEDTTSWVDYSTKSGVYDNSAGNDNLTRQHVVVLEGLVPGTTYYYRVRVKDINEVEYTSQEYTFKAILKPKISNMRVKDVTPYSITISWDTNVDTETLINWGKTTSYGEKRGVSGLSKVHEIKVDGLEDNQEYHYQILAKDEAGNEVADEDKVIRTPLDKEGPKIENVKLDVLPMGEADATGQVIISWTTNKPATTMVEYDEGVIGGKYSLSTVEDKSLNTSHTVIVKELKPATSYHYRIISKDKRENVTVSQDFTFVTPTKEKSILQLIIKSLEDTFSWTKNLNQFFGNIGRRLTGN
jgi:phosphodiesterase/alkaline phosphatase D-like protein